MQGFTPLMRVTRYVALRLGRARGIGTDARRLLLVAMLALGASGCDREDAPTAALGASEPTLVAVDAATSEVMATEVGVTFQDPGDRHPILNFQGQDAACVDLVANGAEWAFVVTTAPSAGNRVASGFHARGCANVFEAALAWRLVDGLDALIAEGFGTASCGTGCVGTFDLVVGYPPRDAVGIGYLEVFTDSPEDGRAMHVNRIPLILE